MGDINQKSSETELQQSANVVEEPFNSQIERRAKVRDILNANSLMPKVGSVDDPSETQADSLANTALSKNSPSLPTSSKKARTQQHEYSNQSYRPLSEIESNYFEPRFGADFSDVRLNYSSESSRAANRINARAFTIGSEIHFSDRSIGFDSSAGKRTLAHELAHVVQNRQSNASSDVIRRESVPNTSRLEFDYSYLKKNGDKKSNAANIELAVMVRIFYNLQLAGLISDSEHLGDDLNYCQYLSMEKVIDEMDIDVDIPETYEAALRVLVTDSNGDGRFDINIDRLSRSGLLAGDTCISHSKIISAIINDYTPSKEWLDEQSDDADNSYDWFGASTEFVNQYGGYTDEGQIVADLNNKGFETDVDRYYMEAKTLLRELKKEDDFEGVVSTAITKAHALKKIGENRKAAQLIALALRSVISSNTLTNQVLTALDDEKLLKGIESEVVDIRLSSNLWFQFDEKEGVEIDEEADDFEIPLSELISLIYDKQNLVSEISDSIEEDVNQTPTLENLTKYMHDKVASSSHDEVKTALGQVLSNFFVHSGGGVKYPGFKGEERESNISGLYDALSYDGAGRLVIDCDGFVSIAKHLLDDGGGRFQFVYMDKWTLYSAADLLKDYDDRDHSAKTHAIMAVLDVDNLKGFYVSNDQIKGEFDYSDAETESDVWNAMFDGLIAMGYTSELIEVRISMEQAIYDGGYKNYLMVWTPPKSSDDNSEE